MDSQQVTFRLLVWGFFFLGVSLHILLRARATIAAKSNSVTTFRIWWRYNWRDLGWRLFLDGLGLMFWEVTPYIPGLKEFVSHILPPVCAAAAPVMGVVADRFIDSGGFISGFGHADMNAVAPKE